MPDDAPAADDPTILPFAPADGGDDGDPDDDGDPNDWPDDDEPLSFDDLGPGEDLETAYRKALAAVDAAEPLLSQKSHAKPRAGGEDGETPDSEPEPRVSPREVIEAALFVGGAGLTAARAGKLLRGTYTDADLAAVVGELNRRYAADGRPYRVAAGEDGWAMQLRAPFEPVRRRLYGLGPREVSLPPAALEVLSVVAYGQPITREAVERSREGDAGPALRRLVRLGLLEVAKPAAGGDPGGEPDGEPGGGGSAPAYRTTDRFLDLFGLGGPEELPRPDDLNFK